MFIYLASYDNLALLIVRIVLGAILIVHGWPKLRYLKKTAVSFDQMGFKPGALFGSMAAFLEFFGGIAVIIGLLVQPIAVLLAIQFVVILAWRISKKHSFVGGWELDLLILGAALLLLSLGAGDYSTDAYLFLPWF